MPCSSQFNPKEKTLVPIVQEAGWAPVSVWMGAEYLASTGTIQPVVSQYTVMFTGS